MNVIDLEIMIPASPDFIWRFLGDITKAVDWQEGVKSISFLTTQREGKGTRWRYGAGRGNDIIAEIGAWYDTLGYEYKIVDGGGFGDNQGRIRLTEVPEGTIVRWTFNYELRGMLGGLRNAMRHKRGTSKQIQDSLRNLHRLVQKESGGISTHQARASVRDAPDADERSIYTPRHPSTYVDSAAGDTTDLIEEESPERMPFGFEPLSGPLSAAPESDTKPNPVVQTGEDLAEPILTKKDTDDVTKPIDMEIIAYEPIDVAEAIKSAVQREDSEVEDTVSVEEPRKVEPSEKRAIDTSTVSVFELFGLQRPSQTDSLAESDKDIDRSGTVKQSADIVAEPTPEDALQRLSALRNDKSAVATPPGDGDIEATTDLTIEEAGQSQQIVGMRRISRRRRFRLRSHNV